MRKEKEQTPPMRCICMSQHGAKTKKRVQCNMVVSYGDVTFSSVAIKRSEKRFGAQATCAVYLYFTSGIFIILSLIRFSYHTYNKDTPPRGHALCTTNLEKIQENVKSNKKYIKYVLILIFNIIFRLLTFLKLEQFLI